MSQWTMLNLDHFLSCLKLVCNNNHFYNFCLFTNYIVWDYLAQDWFMNSSCSLLWRWWGPGTRYQRTWRCSIPGSSKSGWTGSEQCALVEGAPSEPRCDSVIVSSININLSFELRCLHSEYKNTSFASLKQLYLVSACNWEFCTVFFAALPK